MTGSNASSSKVRRCASSLIVDVPHDQVSMSSRPNHPLCISLNDASMRRIDPSEMESWGEHFTSETEFFAVIGILNLQLGPYLLVVTERKWVGNVLDCQIWQIKRGKTIPIFRPAPFYETLMDRDYIIQIESLLSSGMFFYSHTFNLTQSIQLQHYNGSLKKTPLHSYCDTKFFWNQKISSSLLESEEYHDFVVPVICGYVGSSDMNINSDYFSFLIISRRDKLRAGCRYTRRGVDKKGNVANFVETEQIVTRGNNISSYLQTRGSIPVLWKQEVNLNYKPRLQFKSFEESVISMKEHLNDQVSRYGEQTLISLIDHKGFEKPLRENFKKAVQDIQHEKVKYVEFSLNQECKGMNYSKIEVLLDNIRNDIDNYGVFSKTPTSDAKPQIGIFRTNCLDCLDRTNLTQTYIAKEVVIRQINSVGISLSKTTIESNNVFMSTFRRLWADNGDYISSQYAGTGALKADFTRTGQRRIIRGGLADLQNSISRYYLNNFVDGKRQDSIDLFLGSEFSWKITMQDPRSSWIKRAESWYVSLLVTLVNLLGPKKVTTTWEFVQAVFWSVLIVSTCKLFRVDGKSFTNRPVLKDEAN